jgi:hypothetical protein
VSTTPLPSHLIGLLDEALRALRVRLEAVHVTPTIPALEALLRAGLVVCDVGDAVVRAARGEEPPEP